ncbi:phosphodiester glycosidase family protein [Legionella nagasakiensis]|uniref:phosphodiester glycosidase family protein n=1 Tax=Legionella nagasakiensis TaxID=535290 RepID=UPI0010541530|nr:phosphodiester glycosidase family protein [Legionella nagasakiensis]
MVKPIVLLIILLSMASLSIADNWRELAPGIQYRDLSSSLLNPWAHIHVFRINLQKNQFDLVMANHLSRKHASTEEFAQHSNALIAINGGFFDKNYHSLGLRISNHQLHNPIKHISWWGVFYIKGQKPYLSAPRQFKNNHYVSFALQSGPRLLINGKIPSLKPGLAERTALGINSNDEVIILVTDNTPMTTKTLAEIMKSSPLNCKEALNLDGGSSSQLTANIGSFQLNVHGFSNISDAIIVKPRLPST